MTTLAEYWANERAGQDWAWVEWHHRAQPGTPCDDWVDSIVQGPGWAEGYHDELSRLAATDPEPQR